MTDTAVHASMNAANETVNRDHALQSIWILGKPSTRRLVLGTRRSNRLPSSFSKLVSERGPRAASKNSVINGTRRRNAVLKNRPICFQFITSPSIAAATAHFFSVLQVCPHLVLTYVLTPHLSKRPITRSKLT